MVKIWVQFASTGYIIHLHIDKYIANDFIYYDLKYIYRNPGWSPIKMEQKPIYWYELNDKMGPTTVLQERMEFWNQFSLEDLCYS
jgi:hypothetical protein